MVNKLQKRNPSADRAGTDGSDADTMPAKKERRRLSGIFKRKDKNHNPQSSNASSDLVAGSSTTGTNPSTDLLSPVPNTTSNNENVNSSSTVPTVASPMNEIVHDSAYASSEAPSNSRSGKTNNNNIVPVQNDGQIEGVSKDRNLALNKTTGDVLDEDTGEIVSTVTTTTTTTTTTTLVRGRDGKKELRTNVSTVPAGTTTTALASGSASGTASGTSPRPTRPRDNSDVSEMPADPAPIRLSTDIPAPLVPTVSRGQTPPGPTPLQTSGPSLLPHAPDLPAKSPKRLSREFDRPGDGVEAVPASPIVGSNFGANFSYPNRSSDTPPANSIPSAPDYAPPPPPFAQEPHRHSPSASWSQNPAGFTPTQSNPQLGTPAPFPPPPRPTEAEQYPHGPDDYPNYTTSSAPAAGGVSPIVPPASSFGHMNSQHEPHGYPPGPPSSYGGLSTIESMSETSSVAPSASASQVPSAAPSAPASTFGSLKAAAKGLHGVGETLRGTLNNEIDTRFPRRNAEKAAIANAKNQAALDRGQNEMAGLQPYEGITRHGRGEGGGSGSTLSSLTSGRWPLRREHSIPRKPVP